MRHETRKKLELFTNNAEIVRKGISMTSGEDRRMAALLYTVNGKTMDRKAVEDSYAALKKGTGILSSFRQTPLSTAAMLSMGADPKAALDNAKAVHKMLRDIKFRDSEYLSTAAVQIAAGTEPKNYQVVVNRMRSFYDKMKSKNWLHTGSDDHILAATFALSGANEAVTVNNIDELYQKLKPEFTAKGSVFALAQVLVIGGLTGSAAANRAVALRDALKEKKIRLDKSYMVPALGILSMFPADAGTVAQEVLEAEEFLRAQEGMGAMKVSNAEIQLYAAALAASAYAKDGLVAASVSTAMISVLIAQLAVMMVVVAAAAATVVVTASG